MVRTVATLVAAIFVAMLKIGKIGLHVPLQ